MLRRLAYFSPLPPGGGGIADYSAELLPYLAGLAQVTLFAPHPDQVAAELASVFEVRSVSDYGSDFARYDVALYQMGNSMHHEELYPVLLRYPGVTVLHDYGLHHFMVAHTIPQGDFVGYARALGYALGTEGIDLAYRIRQDQTEYPYFALPLNERVLDHSLGVIVHSQYAKRQVLEVRPNLPVAVIPAPIRTELSSLRSRQELGCPEDALIFVSAGHVIAIKQVTAALEAFARLRTDFPQARFVVVGDELKQDLDLQAWLRQHELGDAVISTGYLADLRDFLSWIAAADVLINLRSPTVGETSATALRGLAAGRPVIVMDHGWYAELPDDACIKIAPNDGEALYQAMRRLAGDPALRRAIGQRAVAYAQHEHTLAAAARGYLAFIEETVARVTDGSRSGPPHSGECMAIPSTPSLDPTEVIEIRDPEVDVDALMAKVRDNVARRRAEGAYSEDLDAIAMEVRADLLAPETIAPGVAGDGRALAVTLTELNAHWMVREVPFTSHVPVFGPVIVAVRTAWNWMSTKWYVQPILHQLVGFNALVVRALNESIAAQQALSEELRRQQAAMDVLQEELERLRAKQTTAGH